MQGGLHAATIQRRGGARGAGQSALPVGEKQDRIAVGGPEAAQQRVRGGRQRHEAIPVAFGVAHMHAVAHGVDVADLQAQPFAQPQAQAVEGEVEHPIAEHAGGSQQTLHFGHRDDVRQALALGRLDDAGRPPGFLQDVLGVELQAIQVELDGAPGVGAEEFGEVVGQLRFAQGVDAVIEVRADAADGARVGFDGLGLQALELEMLEMGLVLPVKSGGGWLRHAGVSSRLVAKSLQRLRRSVREDYVVSPTAFNFCRVAASSNSTAFGV